MLSPQAMIDFAFSLGLIAVLVTCYGALRRRLPGTKLAPQLLGLLFGAVAIVMMWIPLNFADGVIVDLRVVPVVLAGAFLGLRGALIVAFAATAMRMSIGGIGSLSGVTAVWLAAAIGMSWSMATLGPVQRPIRSFVVLGAMCSLSLSAGLLLPTEIALRFYSQTAPVLAAIYLVVVPVLAYLLERQRIDMQREAWARSAVAPQASPTFEGAEALARALASAETKGRFRDGAVVLSLRIRSSRLALSLWGPEVEIVVLRALRDRLATLLPATAKLGIIEQGSVLVFLQPGDVDDVDATIRRVCRGATAEPIAVPGMASVRLRMSGRGATFETIPTYAEIGHAFDKAAPRRVPSTTLPALTPEGTPSAVVRLFNAADRLLEVRRVPADPHTRHMRGA